MKTYSPIEYLCIDIANNFGLDKELFSTRIQWVKDNYNKLEELESEATEDAVQYKKSVMALRSVVRGEETGHLISLDSTCSGIQILSAITGCKAGARITNLMPIEQRFDAYTEITRSMNNILRDQGKLDFNVSRSDAKDAVMKGVYGSKAEPRNIFGDGPLLDMFYQACFKEAPGAYGLLDVLTNVWQPNALAHSWNMPDNFHVQVKVMQTKETRIEVDELDHHQFVCQYKVNEGTPFGVSLVANTTHSIDAYILRTLIRRTSMNRILVKECLHLLEGVAKGTKYTPCDELNELFQLTTQTNIVDPVWFTLINKTNIKNIPYVLAQRLIGLGTKMLSHKAYDLLTVHDAFRQHANYCQNTRYWYAEILAELAESKILENIVSQITDTYTPFRKYSNDLGNLIRQSDYAIC